MDASSKVEQIPPEYKVGEYEDKNVHRVKGKSGKFDGNYLYSLVESFKVFASNSGTFWPVVWFLVLYYIIFGFYIFGLQDACTKPNEQNCTNSTSMWKSKEAFRLAVKDSNEKWTIITEVMGIFLGLFVASMMSRWWAQVSSMPDISPVAMVLNCWVLSGEGSLELKKTILRYCLLSYNAVMIQISPREIIKSEQSYWSWLCCCCSDGREEGIGTPDKYDLILSKDAHQVKIEEAMLIDKLNNSRYWFVPINQACTLIRDRPKLIPDATDVMAAIMKYQNSLGNLIQFDENPFPPLCVNAVNLISWVYLSIGAFAVQHCDSFSTPENLGDWFWLIILHIPSFPLLIIIFYFAWKRMAEISMSPFDGDFIYDLKMNEEMEVQIFNASLALYKANHSRVSAENRAQDESSNV